MFALYLVLLCLPSRIISNVIDRERIDDIFDNVEDIDRVVQLQSDESEGNDYSHHFVLLSRTVKAMVKAKVKRCFIEALSSSFSLSYAFYNQSRRPNRV